MVAAEDRTPSGIASAIRAASAAIASTLEQGDKDPIVVVGRVVADNIEQGLVQSDGAHAQLNVVRDLVIALEESDLPETIIEAGRQAHAAACDLFGFVLSEEPHQPLPPAAQLARHLADLCEFHRDDPDDVQHVDLIDAVQRRIDGNGAALRITLESGTTFIVLVAQEG